jgi:uncharacterized protein YjiS (DUF1127 family)
MYRNPIVRSAARVSQWMKNTIRFHKEVEHLNELTDRDLRDMGINRYDVRQLSKNIDQRPIGR